MTADLRRWGRELSRTVARHRALLAAGLAAAAVATALPVLAPTPAPGRLVLTAARDLAAGTALTADDLAPVTLPRSVVPAGALTSREATLGRLVAGPVRRGEPLTDVRLLGAALLATAGTPGLVAAPVRLADSGVAALLHAGDRVDVLAATSDAVGSAPTVGPPDAHGPRAAAAVAVGALVLAVPGPVGDGEGALIVLAVPPPSAARLAAAAVSSRLSVTVLGR